MPKVIRRYHRGSRAYPSNLVVAIDVLLTGPPRDDHEWVRLPRNKHRT
ncbi:MAG: hypothetical protein ACR2MN_07935 [Acidimicrobiales bacterium]